MRHVFGLGVVLLFVAQGEVQAAGNQLPPCRNVSWVSTGNLTRPRSDAAAALLPSGKVLVAGSYLDASAELYDLATGTWSPTGSMSLPRVYHTLTLLPVGKVLVAGGNYGEGDSRTAELYDPDTGQWATTGTMLEGREHHSATLLRTGEVLVVGGYGFPGPMASAELYNPASGEWRPTGALSAPRFYHTATLLDSGQVLVLGGVGFTGAPIASAELYDPAAGTWTAVAPMLAARFFHTAALLRSDGVLVAGGLGPSTGTPTEAEIFDVSAGTWRRTGSLLFPHAGHTATRLPSGRILVAAGEASASFGSIANTELFDPESETWNDAGCTNGVAGRGTTATLLLSGAVLATVGLSAELYGIVVSPARVSLAPGASQTFTASKGSGLGYVWSFRQNESGGTLSASGDYRAGTVGGVTDVLQVVDSFANSATATVDVTRQSSAVSAAAARTSSMGCGTTGGAALPWLAGAILGLLGARSVRRPRRARESVEPGRR